MSTEERFNVVVSHAFGGWHRVHNRKPNGTGVVFNVFSGLSTFDFNELTRLVVAAHVVRVRAEVAQSGPRMLRVYLHPREDKPADWCAHHPSADDLVQMIQKLRDEVARAQAGKEGA